MIYINSFQTEADVQSAIDDGSLTKPYVAYIESGYTLDYNTRNVDLSKVPLTFEIISGGKIQLEYGAIRPDLYPSVEYSLNGGDWISVKFGYGNAKTTISVNDGDVVSFRGNNNSYYGSSSNRAYFSNTWSCRYNLYGNIMSLISSTNFKNLTTISGNNAFMQLFKGYNGVVDASNLILPATSLTQDCYDAMFSNCSSLIAAPELPATTLANNCYQGMFEGCTGLTSAPVLSATTLSNWCYSWMFNGCTNLNYIKCLATDISATSCTNSWLNNVSSTGTFVTPSSTSWDSGTSGIPNNWTRVNT